MIGRYPVRWCEAAWTSGDDRYVKNFATPLYSSGLWPDSTQRVAPPMIEFCGAPATSGQYGIMPIPNSNFPWVAFTKPA